MSNDYFQAFEILDGGNSRVANLYVSKDPATNELTATLMSASEDWTVTSISRNGDALITGIRNMRLGFWPNSTMRKVESKLTEEERRIFESFLS